MVHARAIVRDQLQAVACAGDQGSVDVVGHGRDQHVAIGHRSGELLARQLGVGAVVVRIEQRLHPVHERVRQLAGDDDLRVRTAACVDHADGLAKALVPVNVSSPSRGRRGFNFG